MIAEMTRRDVLKTLSALALAETAFGCRSFGCGAARPKIALQLYSIWKIFWDSPEKILAELRAAGYEGVQFAGHKGKSPADLKKLLGDAGMIGMGTHVNGDVALVGDELRRTLDFYAEAGIESVVTPHAARKTADAYRKFGAEMGRAAEIAAAYGIKIGVHTAPFHFQTRLGGKTAWDLIFSETSPLLQKEIDVGNCLHGGGDPVAELKAGRGRLFCLHAKENDPTPNGVFGEKPTDGAPGVPWDAVMATTRSDESVKWWVVESEIIPDSLEPARRCRELLSAWL